MRLQLALLAALMVVSAPLHTLSAQQPRPAGVTAGDRIRLKVAGENQRRVATVIDASAVQIRVQFERPPTTESVQLDDLRSLDRSLGQRSTGRGALRGAGWGLLTGIALSGVVAVTTAIVCRLDPCNEWSGFTVGLAIVSLPITGTVVGGIAGAAAPGERWQRVPVR